MHRYRIIKVLAFMLLTSVVCAEKINWNESDIEWYSYEDGLEELKSKNINGIVLLYADWCPTCKTYSKLFEESEVVASLDGLVLIKANVDEVTAVKHLIEQDEAYVPKTIAIDSEGNILQGLYTEKKKYMFYLSPNSSKKLLELAEKVKSLNNK